MEPGSTLAFRHMHMHS